LREGHHLENLEEDGRIILKFICKNWHWGGGDMNWIDLSWDGARGGAPVNMVMILQVP